MKTLLKLMMLALTVTVLFALIACGGDTDTTTSDTTTASDTTTETNTVAEVVVNGVSDYVIVYDDSNDMLKSQVTKWRNKINSLCGVSLSLRPISNVSTPYEHEIIVGDLGDKRPVVNTVKANCKVADFAISVQGNDVVLYATDDTNYRYLFEALCNEASLLPVDKTLTFDPEKDFYFQKSNLKDMNYVDYKCQDVQPNTAMLKSIFTSHETTKANGGKMVYRLYVPSNYDPEKEYPLLLFLHGAGERGDNNEGQFAHVITDLFQVENTPVDDAIILIPQCPNNNQWVDTPWANGNYSTSRVAESDELKTVMRIIGELKETYSVDDNRVYAMGISMGGFGTWDLLMRHGDVFAAGVPICGGADVSKAADLAKIPIRTYHGGADTVVPFAGTRAMATAIEGNDPVDFAYKEYPGVGHDVWTRVAQDPSVIKWLFEQSKTK